VEEETLRLYFSPEGEARASVGIARDVFALHPRTVAPIRRALSFNHFRDRRLLDERTALADSVTLTFVDSTLQLSHGFSTGGERVRALVTYFREPEGASFADNFDEVRQRKNQFAELLFSSPSRPEKRVSIYRDTLREQPFVLVSPDFPRRYLALDSLPFGYE
jgi:hypothetical protein